MPIERYTCIERNFEALLDPDKLIKYFADINSGDNDYELERECIISMTMAVPSILVELDRVEDALKLIEQCSKIGYKKFWMHGKLDLMRASLLISRKKDLVQWFEQIMVYLKRAAEIFRAEMNGHEG